MKRFLIGILILLAVGGLFAWISTNTASAPQMSEDGEEILSYFINSMTKKVKATVADYESLGLAGGVDGFNLIRTYPALLPSDFINVQAYQGGYSVENGELFFTGNAASNSAVIERSGMKTLLLNISNRLGIPADSKSDIDRILEKIQG